jgi:uncharacterized protein YbaR (Trm112 family)
VFIELVDDLRCPRAHEETWLVASASRTEGRHIMQGTLGCPICRAEYPIREGVVWFGEPKAAAPAPDRAFPADPELALRLAAFLDLSDAQGFALLAGSWGAAAPVLQGVVPTHLVLLNPRPPVAAGDGISVLEIPAGIPLADASCRGVALDDAHADAAHLEAAVRALRARGRLVAPASTPTPAGVTELARDEQLWVAERDAAPPKLVPLQARGAAP